MNSEITIKQNIENALKNFGNQSLREAATTFLNTLGYYSKRVGNDDIDSDRFCTAHGFLGHSLKQDCGIIQSY